jgi:hypothetical protein
MSPFAGSDWVCVPDPLNPVSSDCECTGLIGLPNYDEILRNIDTFTPNKNMTGVQVEVQPNKKIIDAPCNNNCNGYCMWFSDIDGNWVNINLPENECEDGCICLPPLLFGSYLGQIKINRCTNELNIKLSCPASDEIQGNNYLDTSVNSSGDSAQSTFMQTIVNSSGQIKVIEVKDGGLVDTKIKGISSVIGLRKQP